MFPSRSSSLFSFSALLGLEGREDVGCVRPRRSCWDWFCGLQGIDRAEETWSDGERHSASTVAVVEIEEDIEMGTLSSCPNCDQES